VFGVTVGAVTGFLVDCVGEGPCVGVLEGLAVRVGEAEAEPEALAEACGEGVALVSVEGDELFISIGMMMSAPTTKNTAAMATLEICIGVLRGWGHAFVIKYVI
jgi:hypothetical protein